MEDSGGQAPDAPAFEVEHHVAQALLDDRREWNREDARRFGRVDSQFSRTDYGDERRDVEVVDEALTEHRQLRDDRHARRLDADLFVQLAKRGRLQIGVVGVHAAAGKADLSGMVAQVRRTLDEDDSVRRVAKDSDDYRSLAAKRRHVSELAQKTCVPCRGGVPPLGPGETGALLAQIDPAWRIEPRDDPKRGPIGVLVRTFTFDGFADAMDAAVRIGAIAEEQQHHPDLTVSWGRLQVEIWTHKIGGLTESDFVFAAKCDDALAR